LSHCSGFRVNLSYGYREVSSGVGESIEAAFTDAEQYFDRGLQKYVDNMRRETEARRAKAMIEYQKDMVNIEQFLSGIK